MRPIWTGAVGFGLVNIPVKLYSATKTSRLDLDMLDKNDLANIKYARVNEETGKEVDWNDIVKGYKLEDDGYVVLTDKDFEQAGAEKSNLIEITEFVDENKVESFYYEKPYYLEPEKEGERAYALLREALAKTGKAGIATFVMREKERLAVLKASKDVIVLNRIRFGEEIRSTDAIDLPKKTAVKANELKMAVSLINELSGTFDISKYKDTFKASLMKLIEAKAKGKVPKAPKMKVTRTRAKDLMSQLKASLEKQPRAS